ncbi:MAG: putative major capsid protein [Clostridia bacterium]|jgi:HK97 family phage major capsid protein|nr:putative major capsid protein [Clostridia bacterium]
MDLLAKKNERKAAINTQAQASSDVAELRNLNAELDGLNVEIRSLEEMIAALPDEEEKPNERTAAVNGQIPGVVVASAKGQEQRKAADEIETRIEAVATDLRSGKEVAISADIQEYLEKRAVTTANIMLENKYKREVAENFNEVAQTIDLVDAFPLDGGSAYDVSFQITDGDADYAVEGETYTNDEGTFGTASTGRAKITNSAIVNEEVVELPNADYLTRIVNSVRKSIRKKASNQIIAGLGGTNQLKGIYNAPAILIPDTYKVEVSEINGETLRKIVFAYGGDEDIESPATLFLSKLDLAAFAAVKATDGRPYYSITYNGANGTIEEVGGGLRVPYSINSACNALSNVATVVGTKTMVYGSPTNYELPLFSPLTIKRSDERYIDQGKIGFFGKTIAGGIVNKYKGFIPIVKIAAV